MSIESLLEHVTSEMAYPEGAGERGPAPGCCVSVVSQSAGKRLCQSVGVALNDSAGDGKPLHGQTKTRR